MHFYLFLINQLIYFSEIEITNPVRIVVRILVIIFPEFMCIFENVFQAHDDGHVIFICTLDFVISFNNVFVFHSYLVKVCFIKRVLEQGGC